MISPQEEKILHLIDQKGEELAAFLQQLIRFRSVNPPGHEGPIADFLSGRLRASGFDVKLVEVRKERPSLIAELRGSNGKRKLLFYAHMDVVPVGDLKNWSVDPFEGKRVGDKIFGRGSQDHKFPIPPLIIAADMIMKSGTKLKGDLMFTFVADEEMGGRAGFRPLIEKGYYNDTDCMIYAGCRHGKGNVIAIGANGALWVTLAVKGKAVHTSRLEQGVNAIAKSVKVLLEFQQLADRVNLRTHPLTGKARMSINKIWAGEKENVLPDKCLITIDRRLTPSETYAQAEDEIWEIVKRLRGEDPSLEIELEMERILPTVECQPDSEIVKVVKGVAEDISGETAQFVGASGSGDYSWYVNILKKPCCSYGISSAPTLAHQSDEHCLVPDLVKTSKAYALVMLRYLGVR